MGPKFSVAQNSVNVLSTNLDSSIGSLLSQGGSFFTAIQPLQADWKGEGASSWDSLTEQWGESMVSLNAALTSIKTRVGNAGALYDQYHSEQAANLMATMGSANWDGTKFNA